MPMFRRMLPLAVLLTGCTTETLAQSWQLDRLRILGVRSLPAEPQPGQAVTLQAATYVPEGIDEEELGVVWFACLPESADEFGCDVDTSVLENLEGVDFDKLSPKELQALYKKLQAAGLIGFEPLLPAQWVTPKDALEGLSEVEQLEGVSAVVTLQAIPAVVEDEDDIEIAYKRVPISLAKTPNHNPEIVGLAFEGNIVPDGGRVEVARMKEYSLEPAVDNADIETYTYVTSEGTEETREEEPYFSWYTEGGSFDQPFSLWPTSVAYWTAPEEPGEYELRVVMRDRRGGMAWSSLTAIVRE